MEIFEGARGATFRCFEASFKRFPRELKDFCGDKSSYTYIRCFEGRFKKKQGSFDIFGGLEELHLYKVIRVQFQRVFKGT